MEITVSVLRQVPLAVNSLFLIKGKSNGDAEIQNQCQETIDMLLEKFPGLFPASSELLAKQDSRIMEDTSIVRLG